ncbi:hypothetical protein S1OALGB6SA_220 [Olavius algarvensis spirochete endosymbiont]|nr:MAG: hypothetical protein [Olavius algarvensis spirochete endosymbiont]VDA99157.1 hypothetical protein S1OALGB6SA_220 [Olavius algarvensis spirochete endosymbiont]
MHVCRNYGNTSNQSQPVISQHLVILKEESLLNLRLSTADAFIGSSMKILCGTQPAVSMVRI